MATTTIPWNDGSGDNIYLTYPSASGNQTVSVSSDANASTSSRTQVVTFTSGVGSITQQLTINQAASSLPYTPVDYIQTDGTAYINTGVSGSVPKSVDMTVLLPSATDCVFLGKGQINTSSQVASMFVPLYINSSRACFGYRYRYLSGAPSISTSITNQTPFRVAARFKNGGQWIGVMQEGDTAWTSLSKTQQNTPSGTTTTLYLFRDNYSSAPLPCPSGSRVYYCTIYGDYDYGTLVFDGVPCVYQGEYGLWDNVSNSFFGNAAGSGAFTGPSIQ